MQRRLVIHLQPLAPPKPCASQACNGCGVCCAVAPCPLGMLLSRRTEGACVALEWDADGVRYTCGAVSAPERHLPWLPAAAARRLALRWISAARGCDSTLEVDRAALSAAAGPAPCDHPAG
jgi:hypothetical protein